MDADRPKVRARDTFDLDVDAAWTLFVDPGASDDPARPPEDRIVDAAASEAPDGPAVTSSRYELLDRVAVGAMGVVHAARDLDLRRKVAFKTMLKDGPVSRRRFLHEARITAQLDHPNVVPVYGVGADAQGRPAYAMKFVRGRTLDQLVADARARIDRGEPLPEELRLAARLDPFRKICDAVAYAHSRRVVHRDLKPENIMVGRFGEVYVMDWGIAKLLGPRPASAPDVGGDALDEDTTGSHRHTQVGAVLGTPAYMSPEQARGEIDAMSERSDVFTLGLVLYELVHLRPAYGGADPVLVLAKAANGRLDPAPGRVGGEPVPADLAAIVARATALAPADRYPSADALEADLRRWMRGEETLALPDTRRRRVRRWITRHVGLTVAAVGMILLASVFATVATYLHHEVELAEQRAVGLAREQRIAALVGRVSTRAQEVDHRFSWYEGRLEGIGAAALYALAHGRPTEGPYFDAASYRDPSTAPSDLTSSPRYGKPVSPTWPVYKVAPGVAPDRWRRDLERVDGLRETLRNVFLVDPTSPAPPATAAEAQARIVGAERSMRWAYVALEDSGLMYLFPGAAGWDEAYDPRTRPWYRDAVGQHGLVWGNPYVDLMGQGRLVSCVLPLYADGRFVGVAGLDLQFDDLLREFLELPSLDGYEAAWLLEGDRVLLETTAADDPVVVPPTEVLDPGIDLGVFDVPAVVARARAGEPGHLFRGDHLYVWAPLRHRGWTYVVSFAASAVRSDPPAR